jgi:hypothetical protein
VCDPVGCCSNATPIDLFVFPLAVTAAAADSSSSNAETVCTLTMGSKRPAVGCWSICSHFIVEDIRRLTPRSRTAINTSSWSSPTASL